MVVRASTRGVPVVLEGAECGMASAHGTAGVTAGKGEGSRGLRSKLSLNATKSAQEPRFNENITVLKPTIIKNEPTLAENSPQTSGRTHIP